MKNSGWIALGIVAGAIFVVLFGLLLSVGMRDSGTAIAGKSVGLVEVEGVMMDSRRAVREIRRFAQEPNVPVILLRINSPGGVVTPAQEIHAALLEAKAKGKKLVASMGMVAASGGYYIAAPADMIIANPSTITGSIGVIMEFPNVTGLLGKLGISVGVVKSREFKDIGSPYREMKPEERELLKGLVMDVYDQFVDVVAEERSLPRDSVLKLADGRVLSGRQARNAGLVDSLGSFQDAVRIAGELAGIKGEPKIVRQPKPFRILDFITEEIEPLTMPKLEYRFR